MKFSGVPVFDELMKEIHESCQKRNCSLVVRHGVLCAEKIVGGVMWECALGDINSEATAPVETPSL